MTYLPKRTPITRACAKCVKTVAEGATFGRLTATGKLDKLCTRCRFAEIDDRLDKDLTKGSKRGKLDIP